MPLTQPAANPLTEAEIVDVLRFAGFPAQGTGPTMDVWGRFYVAYTQAEYRIRNLTDPEVAVTRAKLTELTALDTAVASAGDRLSTASAAVWTRNANEVRDRDGLFRLRRRELCAFLGIGPGDALGSAGLRLVV